MATFTANGVSSALVVRDDQKPVLFTLNGPWDGRVVLQEGDAAGSSWRRLFDGVDGATNVVRAFQSKKNVQYRVALFDTVAAITNGTFTGNADGWTLGADWAYNANTAAATASTAALSQTITGLVPGATYRITASVTVTSGGVTISLGGTDDTEITVTDTSYEVDIVAGSSNSLLSFTGSTEFTGIIDTVTIAPVITYTLGLGTTEAERFKNADGETMRVVDEDGNMTIPGTLGVTGAITATGGVVGDVTGNVTGNITGAVTPSTQALTAEGAVSTTAAYTSVVGTFAITLAAPSAPGIVKVIAMIGAGGSVTMALTNVVGGTAGTSATFDAAGETLVLVSNATKWVVIKEHGVTLA